MDAQGTAGGSAMSKSIGCRLGHALRDYDTGLAVAGPRATRHTRTLRSLELSACTGVWGS